MLFPIDRKKTWHLSVPCLSFFLIPWAWQLIATAFVVDRFFSKSQVPKYSLLLLIHTVPVSLGLYPNSDLQVCLIYDSSSPNRRDRCRRLRHSSSNQSYQHRNEYSSWRIYWMPDSENSDFACLLWSLKMLKSSTRQVLQCWFTIWNCICSKYFTYLAVVHIWIKIAKDLACGKAVQSEQSCASWVPRSVSAGF